MTSCLPTIRPVTPVRVLSQHRTERGSLFGRIRDGGWRLLRRRWIPYLCKSVFVSSCLDDSRPKPWHYGLRMPMISPILRLVARPELSRVKLTSRPTRLKKEVALAGKTSPFG
jgi:hypothetical protein